MLEFLLLLLLFFIVVPVIKVMWRIWQLRRAYRNAQQQMNDVFNRARQDTRNAAERNHSRKKKKIDPDIGEYVAFEEIKTTVQEETADTNTNTRIKIDSQIEDASWEDLP